ncbi:MAG: glycosyltransferase family 2 protein [Chlorobium sp.]|nr:glycosyltransferase family 2 protein [Chlorobium sp.]
MLLSICIPTYNRADCLHKTLLSIVEARQFEEKCEIVISDNNSSDSTREVVSSFTSKYENIRYYKNDSNVGADKNFINLLNLGNGKYLKLHSDKTLFCKDKLDALLYYLSNLDSPSIFLLNQGTNNQTRNVVECKNLNEFVDVVSFMSTWMSGAIYRKSDYQNITGVENKIGLHLIQTYLLFKMVSEHSKAIVITEHLMQELEVEKGGYNLFEVFICNYLALYNDLLQKHILSRQVYNMEKKRLLQNFIFPWYTLIVLKKDKKYKFDMSNSNSIIFRYYWREYRLYLFPLYLLKTALVRTMLHLRNFLTGSVMSTI